jgi:hypothetical protein
MRVCTPLEIENDVHREFRAHFPSPFCPLLGVCYHLGEFVTLESGEIRERAEKGRAENSFILVL